MYLDTSPETILEMSKLAKIADDGIINATYYREYSFSAWGTYELDYSYKVIARKFVPAALGLFGIFDAYLFQQLDKNGDPTGK